MNIIYFQYKNIYPAVEFINSIKNRKLKAKTLRTIDLLETWGKDLREPYCKHIDDGIFELRTKQSSNITRIMFFFFDNNMAILTNGFIKKTDKTPPNEISKAMKYRKMYLNRENDDEP